MSAPIFGRVIPCRRCDTTGLLARNGRPAGLELVAAVRRAGRHPRDISAEPEPVTVPGTLGMFRTTEPTERLVKRCRSCEGEGFLEQSARAGVGPNESRSDRAT